MCASHTSKTMRFLTFVCAVIYVSAEVVQDAVVFHKCCPNNHSLIKVSSDDEVDSVYQCIDRENAYASYNVSISPLILGEKVQAEYAMPSLCDQIQMVQVTSLILNKRLNNLTNVTKDNCYDRLVLEVVNGTLKPYIPRIVELSCVNETEETLVTKINVNRLRKCCPRGQRFDSNFHVCRHSVENNTEDWLLRRLNMDENNIYEVDNELICKSDEYGIQLKEKYFSLIVDGNHLQALNREDQGGGRVAPGEWCIDGEYDSEELVARVCSRNCAEYGAFCIKKCCPIGQHFQPRRCTSLKSKCVPNEDDLLFNITDYQEHLVRENPHITDIMGFSADLLCPEGRIVLNKSSEQDHHYLDKLGRMHSPISYGLDYCIEAFDRRKCPAADIFTTGVNCFIKSPQMKDFSISFILISISALCLGLTLVVYLALPELRNLHGRTLICHTAMMLVAYGCLARVQYSQVSDDNICVLLGYGIYFGFVAAFAWLNVMCFDIWWTFGSVRTVHPMRKASAELRRFLWYSLYAWSTSILLTLTMYLLDKYPVANFLDANIGTGICWFGSLQNSQSDWPHYIFFVAPLGIVMCINFVLWVLTSRHCALVKAEVHRLQAGSVGDRAKRRFRIDRAKYILTGKLWVVMGAGWISELLSTIATEPRWLWSIIDLINELQGVFIFLILVMKPKLYYLVRKRLGLEKPDAQKNGASSSGRTSSTFLSRGLSTDERNARISLQNNVKQS